MLQFCSVSNSLSHTTFQIKWEVYFSKRLCRSSSLLCRCVLHAYVDVYVLCVCIVGHGHGYTTVVIDEQNTLRWCLHLWPLGTAFTYCCPLNWLPIWLRSEVVEPCFIPCEQTQHPLWTQLFIDKCSCNMLKTLPSDIFNSSDISRYFNLRLAKSGEWSFFFFFFLVFSGTTVEFRWPERSALFVSIRPRLESAYHLLTIVSNGVESECYLSSHCFTWTVFFPSESNALSTLKIRIFSVVLKFCSISFTWITVICKLMIRLCSNFDTCHLKVITL